LTVGAVQRHFPESDETQKGHMKAQWQGVRSTKEKDTKENNEEVQRPIAKKKDVYIKVYDATKRSMYSEDQTGRFPVTSSRGHKYIMVAVELDGNYVDAEPIKSRKAEEFICNTKNTYVSVWYQKSGKEHR
jgi:hypothetical protein